MTTSPVPQDPDATTDDLAATASKPVTGAHPGGTPDPITGEPDAHPVGVGVGAFGGGAAGAALGAFAGPIGVVVGAAIGAIAGGLAGKEVAETPESIAPVAAEGDTLDEFDHPATGDDSADTEPLSKPLADRLTPHEDAFFTGGTLSGRDPDAPTDTLDEFDRPHQPAPAATNYDLSQDDENPLPTASSGLITPDESSIFADDTTTGDRTTGESAMFTESPFASSRAVSPGDNFAATPTPAHSDHADTEHAVRTNAYYRYLGREENGQSGSDFEDWIAAEKEILGS